jgi:hypothetical protein
MMNDNTYISVKNYTTAFIGAGPVGLYAAIQIKLLNPDENIIMFERYTEYKRHHPLQLQWSTFLNSVNDKKFQQIISSFGKRVSTSVIENDFLNFAKELGIDIVYRFVSSIAEITNEFPLVTTIIDASGAHSRFRSEFNDDKVINNLNYILDLKYQVSGKTRPLKLFTEAFSTLSSVNHMVVENVSSKDESENTNISLNVFINQEEYDILSTKATFAKPIILNLEKVNDELPNKIYETLISWLKARKYYIGETEVVIKDSLKITVTNLPEYYATTPHIKKENVDLYRVGDSLFGVPYFRSINNGFLCANMLAKLCVNLISLNTYLNYISVLQTKEKLRSHMKQISYNFASKEVSKSQVFHQMCQVDASSESTTCILS